MSIQLKRSIYLVILSMSVSQVPAFAFNQVIEEFDAYIKVEESKKIPPMKKKATNHEQDTIKTLKNQLVQMQEKLVQAETELQLLQENIVVENQVSNADHSLLSLVKSKFTMPVEMNELRELVHQFSDEKMQNLASQVKIKQDEIQEIQSKFIEANESHQAQLAALTAQLHEKNSELSKKAEALTATMNEQAHLEAELMQVKQDFMAEQVVKQAEFEQKQMSLMAELAVKDAQLMKTESELTQMKQKSDAKQVITHADFEQQLIEMQQLLQEHEVELASKVKALEKLAQAKKAVEAEMNLLQNRLKSTSLDKYELKKVRAQLDEKEAALVQVKHQLRSHQQNYAALQQTLTDANEQLVQIKHDLKDKDDSLTQVQQDKSILEQKLAQLEADVQKGHVNATEEMDQRAHKFLTKAYQDIEELHEEIRVNAENYDKIYNAMQLKEEEIVSLRNELESIRWQRNKTADLTKQFINAKQKKCIVSENQDYQIGCI